MTDLMELASRVVAAKELLAKASERAGHVRLPLAIREGAVALIETDIAIAAILSADTIRQEEGKTLSHAIKQAKQNLALTQGCMECNADDVQRWRDTVAWLEGLA